jgi:hypothetical protein
MKSHAENTYTDELFDEYGSQCLRIVYQPKSSKFYNSIYNYYIGLKIIYNFIIINSPLK